MNLVVKIGGSLCIGDKGPDEKYVKAFLPVARKVMKGNKCVFAIGGGRLVRNYYKSMENLNISNAEKEKVLIEMLRSNVMLFSIMLKIHPLFTLEDLKKKKSGVIGGIKPGRSTDANAAYAAAMLNAVLVKMTNVDGIYDRDPNKYRNAKKLREIKFFDLMKYSVKGVPVSYGILDPTAMHTIVKNRIRTYVIDGRNPENLLRLLRGKKIGTVIC